MNNFFAKAEAPRLTKLVQGGAPVPVPPDTSHIYHSFFKNFSRDAVEQQGYALKYVLRGRERYEINGRRHTVSAGNCLLVGHGSLCRVDVDEKQEVEAMCVYLSTDLMRNVWHGLSQSPESLLDNQDVPQYTLPAFVDYQVQVKHSALNPYFAALKNIEHSPESLTDAAFYAVAEVLCTEMQSSQKHIQSLPAQRKATREELYRRLLLARDYLCDNMAKPLSLPELAHVASLSEYHFLRQFKAAFGLSPYNYLLQLRLRKAKELLLDDTASMKEVASMCGFSEVQAFSKLFRKHTGIAPSRYYAQVD